MILKFWNEAVDCWVYEDRIASVSVSVKSQVFLELSGGEEGGLTLVNQAGKPVEVDQVVGHLSQWATIERSMAANANRALLKKIPLDLVVLTYRNGTHHHLLFHRVKRVFLMNDEGKTIERL